eukprot:2744474-Amphidinium_carterae.1
MENVAQSGILHALEHDVKICQWITWLSLLATINKEEECMMCYMRLNRGASSLVPPRANMSEPIPACPTSRKPAAPAQAHIGKWTRRGDAHNGPGQ